MISFLKSKGGIYRGLWLKENRMGEAWIPLHVMLLVKFGVCEKIVLVIQLQSHVIRNLKWSQTLMLKGMEFKENRLRLLECCCM
jgi:hypothetical protein